MKTIVFATLLCLSLQAQEVYFSPRGGCTDAVVREIGKAKTEVLVQAYSFTSEPIAQALAAAKKRGVQVEAVIDKGQLKRSAAPILEAAKIKVVWDGKHAIAHNKIVIVDRKVVLTGSFNFSAGAETRNAENLLVLHDPELARRYATNWVGHASHSMPRPVVSPKHAP